MRGEVRTPGGKVIAVELDVAAGLLANVHVTGDFGVHPEPAAGSVRAAIAAALTGAPADLAAAALAARVRAAVPFGVELVGATPDAVAAAVRQAVGGDGAADPARVGAFPAAEIDRLTASWRHLPWRLIPERPRPPEWNVALDEVLTDRVAAGRRPPTLRFWGWDAAVAVVGRTQSVVNEVDLAAARAAGVRVVRRMTGGGAMFVQPHGAITYSLYLPESAVGGLSVRQSYEVCDAWVIRALRALGVDAHHVPVNDVACSDGKIGGAAQARRTGVVLHHTTLAYDMDPDDMARVLRIGREKLRDKATASAAKRVSPLVRQIALSRDAVVAHVLGWFRATYGGVPDAVSDEEEADTDRLVAEKYGHPAWTNEFK